MAEQNATKYYSVAMATCDLCKKKKKDVAWRIDPYALEIFHAETKVYWCYECWLEATSKCME